MSVVFDFNASLNDVAPVSSMSLSVDFVKFKKKKKKKKLMDVICVLFLFMFTSQIEFCQCFV